MRCHLLNPNPPVRLESTHHQSDWMQYERKLQTFYKHPLESTTCEQTIVWKPHPTTRCSHAYNKHNNNNNNNNNNSSNSTLMFFFLFLSSSTQLDPLKTSPFYYHIQRFQNTDKPRLTDHLIGSITTTRHQHQYGPST